MLAERADGADTDFHNAVVHFDIQTPGTSEEVCANVRHALSLDLPRAHHMGLQSPTPLIVVANGPSAKQAPLDAPGAIALNGALKMFTDQGCAPQFWAACDSQAIVADFIPDNPPDSTIYLVASKCHPSVFEKLQGRRVLLWHLADEATDTIHNEPTIMSAVSITLCALTLLRAMGLKRFVTYGWDGCYMDGADHAQPQVHSREHDIGISVGEQVFRTTGPWAAEGQDAVTQLVYFADYTVEVRGGGYLDALLRFRNVEAAREAA